MIPFNKAPVTGLEINFIKEAVNSGKLAGDGDFSRRCEKWFEDTTGSLKTLLTPSCTHALELAALLIDTQPGDEIIMPSYTFVSTANAFVLRGAKIVFVDIRPDTMNIDENLIEDAITSQTKAIVPVHYAGVACEMDTIMAIASKYSLYVIEDAAQGVMSKYKGKALGSIGHMAAFSFHETKNYTSGGEGGLLLINDKSLISRAEIMREKGTNRSQFFRGMVDKYTWVDIGSSLLPSEIQSAYLWGQLLEAEKINDKRLDDWHFYYKALTPLADSGKVALPIIPEGLTHNAHMFYLKLKDFKSRTAFIKEMKNQNILTPFHYIPLHSSPAGQDFGVFSGVDVFTTKESEKLVRLPMYYGLGSTEREEIVAAIYKSLES
ncbi:dTDP-4-amino-4,6-dideoxygalactose transaminase [Vibrio cortegadensis]|uniref:dTDP-4-amino-4,6-dideoxygalactose transaminase n=1 Tax=Vibrio cortegadensis TaxID=1328770 RepID=A0ABV4M718_9VIBR